MRTVNGRLWVRRAPQTWINPTAIWPIGFNEINRIKKHAKKVEWHTLTDYHVVGIFLAN
jgi:hypothetical protein